MRTTTVVIGGGHNGLAMSHRLTERSIDHVVIERGTVANAWRTERWASLRLLTPNWQSRLPGSPGVPGDPDGFMTAREVAEHVAAYATAIVAPVCTGTRVTRVSRAGEGYVVLTDRGTWECRSVVIASGAANVAAVPAIAARTPASVATHTPMTYRTPADLGDREVLVVGASATGVQLASEIRRTGRPVTLAVGEHVRLPRRYRGRDIFWWLDVAGVLDQRFDEVDDLVRARHVPSPQLIGGEQSLDLDALTDIGVRVVGRLAAITDGAAQFSGALANVCTLADLKMDRLLDTFDAWARTTRVDAIGPPERYPPTRVPSVPVLAADLGRFSDVVWATGYRPDHSWLDVPVLDRHGRIRHDGGVVSDAPGMYVLGLNLLRRRRSSYMSGAADDTADLATHLHHTLARV